MRNSDQVLMHRLIGGALIVALGSLLYFSGNAEWARRISMCAIFCSIIYIRDQAESGRWVAIAIIIAGTLLSLIWELSQTLVNGGVFNFI